MSSMTERRRAPRVDLVGQLRGELVSVDVPILVREFSLGGMSFQTSKVFDTDSHHEFMLTLGDGAGVVVRGRVAYCRQVEQHGAQVFIVGIQFLDEDASGSAGDVSGIIEKVH